MLYIFDLGNVIVDIDFNRVLGAWSDFSRVPLATLKQSFTMGEPFRQHERGEISDEDFAKALCEEMSLPLSYEQFSTGWQALFVTLRSPYERIKIGGIESRLREMGKRLNIQKVYPHKFRRTLATMAIDKGMPIEQLQQLLGHKRIDTTLQYAMVKQSNVKIAHRKYIG